MARRGSAEDQLLTARERDYIRVEMSMHFGHHPSLPDGLYLRSWRSGPQQGQARLPAAVQSMLARGLVLSAHEN